VSRDGVRSAQRTLRGPALLELCEDLAKRNRELENALSAALRAFGDGYLTFICQNRQNPAQEYSRLVRFLEEVLRTATKKKELAIEADAMQATFRCFEDYMKQAYPNHWEQYLAEFYADLVRKAKKPKWCSFKREGSDA
jgi:hypothetical protein